jgi:hypothetical protein
MNWMDTMVQTFDTEDDIKTPKPPFLKKGL